VIQAATNTVSEPSISQQSQFSGHCQSLYACPRF